MKERITFVLLLVFLQITFTGCSNTEDPADPVPPTPVENTLTDQEIKTLNNAQMDESYMERMVEAVVNQKYPNIHSILIVKDKELVFERYFSGSDQNWGSNLGIVGHSRETLHDVRSITKSVVSACIGIAIDQGKIASVDQNIFDFFPEYERYKTGLKAQITIKDLLTMTPGMQWDESISYASSVNSEIQMTNSVDPIEFVLSRSMENTPGEIYNYNGGTSQLLAAIVSEVSGMKIDDFADEYLFKPLDIDNYVWHSYSLSNIPAAASGLRLTSRDLMKFGLLYQNKGQREGNQIISGTWIEESFESHIIKPNGIAYYGYQWHILPTFYSSGEEIKLVAAIGNGDQRIFLDENNDLMVVVTAGNYNQYFPKNALALVKDFIYPSFL
jgi:CubicO group peptidase (beta-lactamase class C family)